jgi:hypothetical protein
MPRESSGVAGFRQAAPDAGGGVSFHAKSGPAGSGSSFAAVHPAIADASDVHMCKIDKRNQSPLSGRAF